ETAVGTFRRAFAGKHPGRILLLAPIRIHPTSVGERARQVLGRDKSQDLAPVAKLWHRYLGDALVREALGVVLAADRRIADLVGICRVGCGADAFRPCLELADPLRSDLIQGTVVGAAQLLPGRIRVLQQRRVGKPLERCRQRWILQRLQGLVDSACATSRLGLLLGALARSATVLCNLRQVADALARDQGLALRELGRSDISHLPGLGTDFLFIQCPAQCREQPVHPRIVEAAGDGRIHRHFGIGDPRLLGMVAPPLLAYIAQAVLRAALLTLVQDDEVRKVDHVDLFELTRRPVLAGHDIERQIDEIHDLGVRLTDAGCLDHDEIEACGLVELDDLPQDCGGRQMLPPGCERAHEDRLAGKAVHADPIPQERPATAPPCRIHGDHGDLPAGELAYEARQQLIAQARLAGAPRTGDADDRHLVARAGKRAPDLGGLRIRLPGALEYGDRPGDVALIARVQRPELVRGLGHALQATGDVINHAVEPEPAAVFGGVDLFHPVPLQHIDLVRRDRAPTADDDANVLAVTLAQHVHHVLEVLVVAALVGAHRDGIGILLYRRPHDVSDAAVVSQVDHFRAVCLQQAAYHIDGRIVAVEQGSGGDEPQRRLRGRLLGPQQRRTAFGTGIHGVYAPVG